MGNKNMLLVLPSWHATRLDVMSVCHIQSGSIRFLHCRWRELVTEWGFPSVWGATLDTHHSPVVSHDALQCSVFFVFFLVKNMLSSSDTLLTLKRLYCGCTRLQASSNFLFLSRWNPGHNYSLVLLKGCWLVQFFRPDFKTDLWKISAWNQTDSAAWQGCWIASLSHITVTEICK